MNEEKEFMHDNRDRVEEQWSVYKKYNLPKSYLDYIDTDIEMTRRAAKTLYSYIYQKYNIKNVIFNDPATIVFWDDGSKTVVKAQDGDEFDPEKGLAMAISKRALGNQRDYYHTFKKWLKKYSKNRIEHIADNKVWMESRKNPGEV